MNTDRVVLRAGSSNHAGADNGLDQDIINSEKPANAPRQAVSLPTDTLPPLESPSDSPISVESMSVVLPTTLVAIPPSDTNIPSITTSSNEPPKLLNSKSVPGWMIDAQRRFELVFGSPKLKPIIQMWLEYEALLGYPEDSRKTRLPNKSRPQQVSDWMQRHRLWDKAPPIDKASEFGAMWKGWWISLQPGWRIMDSWPLAQTGPVEEGWETLMKGGGNGFALILLSLSWWMMREKDETRGATESTAAFEDVQWALQQMLQILRVRHDGGGVDGQGMEDESDGNTRPKKRYASEVSSTMCPADLVQRARHSR
jgi:hypothetical protein